MGQIADNMKARRMWVMGMGQPQTQGAQGGGDPTAPASQPTTQQTPGNGQPIDMTSLIALLAGNVAQAQQNQSTYGKLLNTRQNFVQNAENGVGDQAQALIKDGSNGTPVSPAETVAPVLNFHTDNANKTADYTSRMFGFGQQATQGLGALANIIGTQNSNQIAQHQQAREDFQTGFNPNTPTGTNLNPDGTAQIGPTPQAEAEVIRQGGADILGQTGDPTEKRFLAAQVLNAGGVGSYRKVNPNNIPSTDLQNLTGKAATLQQIQRVQQELKSSPALQGYLGNVPKQLVAGQLNKLGGNAGDHLIGGLSSKDISVLNDLNKLNATSDYQAVRGRLDNYLSQKFGNSSVGADKSAVDNNAILDAVQNDMMPDIKAYAKAKGFSSVNDLPGFQNINIPGEVSASSDSQPRFTIVKVGK